MKNPNIAPVKRGLRTTAFSLFIVGAVASVLTPLLLWYAFVSFGGGTGVSLLYVIGVVMAFTAWIPVLVNFILTVVLGTREGRKIRWQKFNLLLLMLWASAGILSLFSLR